MVATQSAEHKQLVDISFLFGKAQLILSLVVLLVTFLIALVCVLLIILYARKLRKRSKVGRLQLEKTKEEESDHSSIIERRPASSVNDSLHKNFDNDSTPLLNDGPSSAYGATSPPKSGGIKSVDFDAPQTLTDSQEQRTHENNPLIRRDITPEPESSTDYSIDLPTSSLGLWYKDKSGQHLMRFIVLIIFLMLSSFVGILILIWKLSSPKITGIFIAVNVLDTVTNFGQGFFILAVFGFEKHWFWMALYKRLRRLFFKVETVELPREEDVEVSVLDLCRTFNQKYKEQCIADLVTDKKYLLRTYENVFSGVDFVDWLVGKGVTKDREGAVQYGQSLMTGRVIAHVNQEHYFHDEPYFYRFCSDRN